MAATTVARSRWSTTRSWAGRAAVLLALAGLALPGSALPTEAASTPARVPAVQMEALGASALTVTGGAEVTVPAETAEIQILLSEEPSGFSVSRVEERGRVGASESAMSVDAVASPRERRAGRAGAADEAQAQATSGADEGGLSEERLSPVVAALAAAGIESETVETTVSPLATEPYGRPSGSVRLDLSVADPTPEGLAALARAVSDAASAEGLVVELFAVGYRVADCAPLEQQALDEAVADARARAERLAAALGVGIGAPVGAFDFGPQSVGRDEGGCADRIGSSYASEFGGLGVTLPPFDPAAPAEVTIVSSLTVSYAVEPAGG